MKISKIAFVVLCIIGFSEVNSQIPDEDTFVEVKKISDKPSIEGLSSPPLVSTAPLLVQNTAGIPLGNLNLEDVVRQAMVNYPQLRIQLANTEGADAAVNQAWGALSPTVAYNLTNQRFTQANYYYRYNGPTASLNIFSGGRHIAEITRSKYALESERLKLTSTQDDVGAAAAEAYINWARAIKIVELSKNNVAAHQKIVNDMTEIVNVDRGRRVDLNQALVRLDNAKLTFEQSTAILETARLTLAKFTGGQLPVTPLGLNGAELPMPKTMEDALSYVNDRHPVLASAQAAVQAANAAVWGARSQYFPSVDVSYGKGYNGFTGQYDNYAQVTVSAPLFNGFQAVAATSAAQSKLKAAELQLEQSRAELKERVAKAYSEYISSRGRSSIGANQARVGDELVEGYYLQFKIARRSLLELLNITAENYQYQSGLINAEYDAKLIAFRLAGSIGLLSSIYGVNLLN